jgi:hypothetical protein
MIFTGWKKFGALKGLGRTGKLRLYINWQKKSGAMFSFFIHQNTIGRLLPCIDSKQANKAASHQ